MCADRDKVWSTSCVVCECETLEVGKAGMSLFSVLFSKFTQIVTVNAFPDSVCLTALKFNA